MKRHIIFNNKPKIIATSSIAGPKESCGCLKDYIQIKLDNDTLDEKSFEKAESRMMFSVIKSAIENSKIHEKNIDAIIAGDLLNQIVSSTFAVRNFKSGYLGIYNACASFTEGMIIASSLIDARHLENVICATSSHFSSAERQYRYPLELGSTRPPQAQWTVTGAGASVISLKGSGPKITSATIGKIVDFGVIDANNMGAAMAPAAADTIYTHLVESNTTAQDYDLIVTGDLGALGSRIVKDLVWEKGYDISKQHVDCGEMIYNICEEEYQGGSGAGCSSLVFNSYFYSKLKNKKLKRILLVATGALLSSLTSQQGESIPGIAHAIVVES